MPKYLNVESLPQYVKMKVKPELLMVYLNAFNNAWDELHAQSDLVSEDSRINHAHEVAMSAALWPGQHQM